MSLRLLTLGLASCLAACSTGAPTGTPAASAPADREPDEVREVDPRRSQSGIAHKGVA